MIPSEDATLLERIPAALFWLFAGALTVVVLGSPVFFLAWFFLGA